MWLWIEFQVFGLDAEPGDVPVNVQLEGDVPDDVFHEEGSFIGFFGYEFLVRSFQEGIDRRTGRVFDDPDQIFDPEKFAEGDLHGDEAALVVRPFVADLLRAGAERGHRNRDAHHESVAAVHERCRNRQVYPIRLFAPETGARFSTK